MFFQSWIVTALSALVYFYNRPIDPANDNYDLQVKYACLVQKVLLMTPVLIKLLLNVVAVQLVLRTTNGVFMNRMAGKYEGMRNSIQAPVIKPQVVALRLLLAFLVGVMAYFAPAVDISHVMQLPSYNNYNPEFIQEYLQYMRTIYEPLYLQLQSLYI